MREGGLRRNHRLLPQPTSKAQFGRTSDETAEAGARAAESTGQVRSTFGEAVQDRRIVDEHLLARGLIRNPLGQ
jgi:hypothetical protein